MKLHQKTLAVSIISILGVSMLITATPVSAATTPASITVSACNASTPSASVTSSSVSWTLATDTLSVTNNCSSGGTTMDIQVLTRSSSRLIAVIFSQLNGTTVTSDPLGSDVTSIEIYQVSGGARGVLLATLTASSPSTGGGGGSGSDAASSSTPTPIFQQFGKPVSGSCDAVAPASLNWSGVSSGGWSESWAEWMKGGLGGAVCTRTLVYSNALGHWVVG